MAQVLILLFGICCIERKFFFFNLIDFVNTNAGYLLRRRCWGSGRGQLYKEGKKDSCISYDTTGMLARGLGRRIDPIVVFGACISSGSL